MEVSELLWLFAALLFLASFLGGLIPLKLRHGHQRILSLGNSFSGGVFLGGGLLHLLPESSEALEKSLDGKNVIGEYPTAFFLCACGFLSILFVEEIMIGASHHGHGHGYSKHQKQHESKKHKPAKVENQTSQPQLPLRKSSRSSSRANLKLALSNSFHEIPDSTKEAAKKLINSPRASDRKLARALLFASIPRISLNDSEETDDLPESDSLDDKDIKQLLESDAKGLPPPVLSSPNDSDYKLLDDSDDEDSHSVALNVQEEKKPAQPNKHEDAHDHNHFDFGNTSLIVAYLLVLALSFHNVFEGLALGTQTEVADVVSLFLAILSHAPLAGFALGVALVKANANTRLLLSIMFIFSITTPLGVIIGIILSYSLNQSTLETTSGVFQSFSAGTFLYVATMEILSKEFASRKDKKKKLFLMVLGFLFMALIKLFEHEHDDDENNDDPDGFARFFLPN